MDEKRKEKSSADPLSLIDALMLILPAVCAEIVLFWPFVLDKDLFGWIELYLLYLLVFSLVAYPIVISAEALLLALRHYIRMKRRNTAPSEAEIPRCERSLEPLYTAALVLSVVGLAAAPFIFFDKARSMAMLPLSVAAVAETVCLAVILIKTVIKKRRQKKEGETPDADSLPTRLFKKKSFVITLAAVLLAAACVPVPYDGIGEGYVDDPEERIFRRRDAILVSYIAVEDRSTDETVGFRIVPFPFNLRDTDEIFKIEHK